MQLSGSNTVRDDDDNGVASKRMSVLKVYIADLLN